MDKIDRALARAHIPPAPPPEFPVWQDIVTQFCMFGLLVSAISSLIEAGLSAWRWEEVSLPILAASIGLPVTFIMRYGKKVQEHREKHPIVS